LRKIEKLSNGQDTAYLGIIGTDVTEKAMNEQGVPEGAYVKQVVVDSPAMKSGIQNGDVIIQLGTTNIRSFRDYRVAMGKCQPGDTTMVTVKRLGKDGYIEVSYEIYLEALK
ncbi:MAG: PDZ domain-containing protein, partial [Lachnospiraceae bacterium]|nr:PDZ domain-containing protein [Lachnospiraceae bacterium]